MEKPVIPLPAAPTYATADEWLIYWTVRAWNTGQELTSSDLDTALSHMTGSSERFLVRSKFSTIRLLSSLEGGILVVYMDRTRNIIPPILDIDMYVTTRLLELGVIT